MFLNNEICWVSLTARAWTSVSSERSFQRRRWSRRGCWVSCGCGGSDPAPRRRPGCSSRCQETSCIQTRTYEHDYHAARILQGERGELRTCRKLTEHNRMFFRRSSPDGGSLKEAAVVRQETEFLPPGHYHGAHPTSHTAPLLHKTCRHILHTFRHFYDPLHSPHIL